ncbi:MAG: hypothetical protein N2Z72_02795 [Bacteroidales bacterium]|nr:hypothetical protein [Bacteroidales bacterium]
MKHVGIIVGMIMLIFSFVRCDSYGKKKTFGDLELYYTSDITEEEADRLGHYLLESGFMESGGEKTVQLTKENGIYQFRAVVMKEFQNDPDYDIIFRLFACEIVENVFPNDKLEFHCCNNKLETIKVLQPFNKKTINTIIVHYDGVSEEELKKLNKYFKKTNFQSTDKQINILILKTGESFQFRMIILDEYIYDADYENLVRDFVKGLSDEVFDGKPVEFHYCTDFFKTIRVLKI